MIIPQHCMIYSVGPTRFLISCIIIPAFRSSFLRVFTVSMFENLTVTRTENSKIMKAKDKEIDSSLILINVFEMHNKHGT